MKREGRFVFDTNVLVSALLFSDSTPGQAFHQAHEHGRILLSGPVVEELNDVLRRAKFDQYLRREERELFLQALITDSVLIEITELIRACRDPKDDKFLELAFCGGATALISGDNDLVALTTFRGVPIFTPSQFLATLVEDPK